MGEVRLRYGRVRGGDTIGECFPGVVLVRTSVVT